VINGERQGDGGHEHEEKRHNRHRKPGHRHTARLSGFLLGYRSADDDDDLVKVWE